MPVDLLGALKPRTVPTGPASAPPKVLSALDKAIAHGSRLSGAIGKARAAGDTFDDVVDKAEVIKATVKEEIEKEPEVAPEGMFFLSDMCGGRLPDSGKDHLFTRFPNDHWAPEHAANIPKIDEFYIWDANVAEALWIGITLGERVLLHGLPGTGKTTAIKQLAAWVNQPYAKFGGKGGIEPSSFLGQQWASHVTVVEAGVEKIIPAMVWKDGLMPPAVRHGYMTTIDEFARMPSELQMALQSLYEKGGSLMIDDMPGTIEEKTIIPAPEFNLFVTDNTLGLGDNMHMFASAQIQDTSTLDRFSITCPVDYLEPDEECYMLGRMHTKCDPKSIRVIVRLAGLIRESYRVSDLPVTLSPRGLDTMCGIMSNGLSLETAIRLVFSNKIADDSHRLLLQEQLSTVI